MFPPPGFIQALKGLFASVCETYDGQRYLNVFLCCFVHLIELQVFAQYPQLGDTTPFAYKWTTQDLSVSFVHSSYTLSNHYFGHMLLCKMMDPLFLSFPSDYFLSFTFSRAPPLLSVLPCIILISFLYFSPDA